MLPETQNRYIPRYFNLIPHPNKKLMKGFNTILLLMMSNAFMTVAWYGHLKLKTMNRFENIGIFAVVLLSWGIAFFEYSLQVPANRLGFKGTGGPFSLVELKVIQEVISITVFTVFTLIVFRTEQFRINHLIGFFFLILAVYFIFKK
jgi:uncharacterized protein